MAIQANPEAEETAIQTNPVEQRDFKCQITPKEPEKPRTKESQV